MTSTIYYLIALIGGFGMIMFALSMINESLRNGFVTTQNALYDIAYAIREGRNDA